MDVHHFFFTVSFFSAVNDKVIDRSMIPKEEMNLKLVYCKQRC